MQKTNMLRANNRAGLHGLGLCAVMAMALIGVTASMAKAQVDRGKTPMITVSGKGVITAVPDIVQIYAGVSTIGKTAAEALKSNSAAMRAVIAKLKSAGIKPKDIQTSSLSMRPRQQRYQDGRPPVITGYEATNQLYITVRDPERLGEMLDSVVVAGANHINGVSFAIAEAGKLKDKARGDAIKNARHKAELYTKAAGARIGRVISIVEAGGPQAWRATANTVRTLASGALPIERGSQSLEVRVQVTWALK